MKTGCPAPLDLRAQQSRLPTARNEALARHIVKQKNGRIVSQSQAPLSCRHRVWTMNRVSKLRSQRQRDRHPFQEPGLGIATRAIVSLCRQSLGWGRQCICQRLRSSSHCRLILISRILCRNLQPSGECLQSERGQHRPQRGSGGSFKVQ
jgi:hypothetical protein